MLQAAGMRRAGLSTTRSQEWSAARDSTVSRQPSVDRPSTTTTSSRSWGQVWAANASRQGSM